VKAVVAILVLFAALGASARGSTSAGWCAAGQLSGYFAYVPGSAGAGNVVYELDLTNISRTSCRLTGLPRLRLVGLGNRPLPTHVIAAYPGQLTAVLVRLAPGAAAVATARFSPDVPGIGETTIGACEPIAYRLRVTAPGGGTLLAPIAPATRVCEHGQMQLSAYSKAKT